MRKIIKEQLKDKEIRYMYFCTYYERIHNFIKHIMLYNYKLSEEEKKTFDDVYYKTVVFLNTNIKTLLGTSIFILEVQRKKINVSLEKYNNYIHIFLALLQYHLKYSKKQKISINKYLAEKIDIDYKTLNEIENSFLEILEYKIYIKNSELSYINRLFM